MTSVLSITGTIFLIIGIGYLSVDRKPFSRDALHVLGVSVVHFALPALIFRSLAGRGLGEILNPGYLGG